VTIAGQHSVDLVQPKALADGGLTLEELEKFLQEMRAAPAWRARADVECDYYDSNQHTVDEIARAERLGLPIVTINLIFATINMILGMEAKTRTDWKVMPDGPNTPDEVADAMTVKLVEAERVTKSDRACSDAYASQMKSGLGWVHIGKNLDPFKYRHKVEFVDRREIWWDMRGRSDDTTDWRWLVRRKWHDADYLKAFLPRVLGDTDVHDLVDACTSHTAPWDYSQFAQSLPLEQDGMITRDWNGGWGFDEWRDTERRRALLYETWYRTWVRGYTMTLPDGRVVEYNQRNPIHLAAAATGLALPVSSIYSKVRLSWWLGPFRLFDMASPYNHPYFPYVPFFCYREDKSRVPYGQIRVMMSMQDEVNARRAKMLWQLSASRVMAREGAFKDKNQAVAEINRPDAYLEIANNADNNKRDLSNIVTIDEHQGLNVQQMEVYRDSVQMINSVAGVYGPMLGDAKSGADAGVAIDMLIQQGTTTLAEPNDNYRTSRTLVGEMLLANIVDEMAGKPVPVQLPKTHPTRPGQKIVLNQPTMTPDTKLPYISNDVTILKTRVALADVPSSPTYQQQNFQMISEIIKGLPPELQPIILDLWVQASNAPNKQEIAERIRKATGQVGPPPDPKTMSPDQLAHAEQEQAEQEQAGLAQQQMQQLQTMGMQADILQKKSAAKLAEAQAVAVLQKVGTPQGKVMDIIQHPEMQGAVVVNVEPPPQPVPPDGSKPGGAKSARGDSKGKRPPGEHTGARVDRDSTSMIQR
jgi:hypothetical protein